MKKTRLLWVDDEYVSGEAAPFANYLWYYFDELSSSGYLVDHAAGPDQAWQKLKKTHKYEGILLDVILPPETTYSDEDHRGWRLTGVLVAEGIKKKFPNLPIVVLTNSKNEEACRRLKKLKQVRFILSKPDCTPEDLVQKLKGVF